MAIDTFIVKNASRCNLNCSYCYMYNLGDDTYLSQPKFMDLRIIRQLANKLRSYTCVNKLKLIHIAFHGGEPLLSKKTFFEKAVKILREKLSDLELNFMVQTNGTLLDEEWCTLFKRLDVQVSISIDGPEDFHNIYRKYHNGKPSYNDVYKGVQCRNKFGVGGIISVINVDIDVDKLYSFYKEISPKVINLLLPDNNYDNSSIHEINNEAYANWLIQLYEIWKKDDFTKRPRITFFTQIIRNVLGGDVGDETLGQKKCSVAVIETDGALEVVDPLRSCGNGFTRNNLNIIKNEIFELEKEPLYKVYHNSHFYLPEKCRNCEIVSLCGGGYLVHRYSKRNGFNNESIYCRDLMKLISHIQNDVVDNIPMSINKVAKIEKVKYTDLVFQLEKHAVGLIDENTKILESFKRNL